MTYIGLQLPCRVEILQTFCDTGTHGLLALPHPHSWIEELLVRLVLSFRIAHCGHQVILLLEYVIPDPAQIGKLQVGVEIDLDHTMADGILVFLLTGSRSAMKDKEDWLVLLRVGLLFHVCLMLAKKFRVQFDIARLVHPMDISEARRDREIRTDFGQGGPDVVDVFRLGVEGVVVDIFVVDAIFFTTSDADFLYVVSISTYSSIAFRYHLEPLLHWSSTFKIFLGRLNVPVHWLLGKIDHVAGE